MLKRQNSYEFIHDLKNSKKYTGVYQLKWRHSLLEHLPTKKLLKTKVQVGSKEICNIAFKDGVVAVQDRGTSPSWTCCAAVHVFRNVLSDVNENTTYGSSFTLSYCTCIFSFLEGLHKKYLYKDRVIQHKL